MTEQPFERSRTEADNPQAEPDLDARYSPSPDLVAREIGGEIIVVPMVAGMGDNNDDLFTLNATGKAIWTRLDGTRTLAHIIRELEGEFEAAEGEVAADVLGLVAELLRRRMVVVADGA